MLLKERYEQLITEYNGMAETYDILQNEYAGSELETKDEFAELEERMESLEAELEEIIADLGESSIPTILE